LTSLCEGRKIALATEKEEEMRALRLLIVMMALLALVGAPLAGAEPKGDQTTLHLVNEPNVFVDVDPCTGIPAQISALETGVIHTTEFPDHFHITGTLRATFTVDLLPLDGEADATGTYTVWFGDNVPKKGNGAATFTLNGQITYPDGTTWSFHQVGHTTFAEGDVPKHEFFKMHCTQIG
jgi:hypothetical protein